MNNSGNRKPFVNPLEALRELGKETLRSVNEDLTAPIAKNIFEQVTGSVQTSKEILPGQSTEISSSPHINSEREDFYRKKYIIEKQLREEDRIMVERRTGEIRIRIQTIHEEVFKISEVTPELSSEISIAAFHAAGDSSAYELNFLENLFATVQDFRKRIEHARVWLHASNNRAGKKNVWGANYKKHGAKYLLSGEHYVSRSAA